MPKFNPWKEAIYDEIVGASGRGMEAFKWIKAVETKSFAELEDSGAFESIDFKITSALMKLLPADLKTQVSFEKTKLLREDRLLKGRQILHMVYASYKVSRSAGAIVDFRDLDQLQLRNDDLTRFLAEWDTILMNMETVPPTDVLQVMFHKKIESSHSCSPTLHNFDSYRLTMPTINTTDSSK